MPSIGRAESQESRKVVRRLQGAASFFLLAYVVVVFFSLAFIVLEIDLAERIGSGFDVTQGEIDANDDRRALIGLIQVLTGLVTFALYLRWLHKAHRNLRVLGATGLRFTPGWAVGWYFIPIAVLFRPFQAMSELWRASNPIAGGGAPGDEWRLLPPPSIVALWWIVVVLSAILGRFAAAAVANAYDVYTLASADYVALTASGLEIIMVLLTLVVVRSITGMQAESLRRAALST